MFSSLFNYVSFNVIVNLPIVGLKSYNIFCGLVEVYLQYFNFEASNEQHF